MGKVYVLKTRCPYYDDIDTIGIYSTEKALENAKEIIVRRSRIDDFANRIEVDEYDLDKAPYDPDKKDGI